MKGFLLLLVLGLSFSYLESASNFYRAQGRDTLPNGCPIKDGINDVYFPDLTDCESYFKCYQGELVLHKCPGNSLWNKNEQYCDDPLNVNCMENAIDELVKEIPNHCEDKATGFMYPDPDDCQNFITCVFKKPVVKTCRDGTLFNRRHNVCDWPRNVNCCENGGEAVADDNVN